MCYREVAGGTNRVKQVLAAFRDAGAKLHQAQFLGRPGGCLRALFDVDAAVRRDPRAAVQVGRRTVSHARIDMLPGISAFDEDMLLDPQSECCWFIVNYTSYLATRSQFRILVSTTSSTTCKTDKVVLNQSRKDGEF
jgi:hypothetical protein